MSTSGGKRIRVLVVEDSPVVRELLVHLISRDPRLEVVGTADDGLQALEQAQRLAPDVITMDIHMPRMDGLEATRLIMERTPTPVVVVSSSSARSEVAASFRIMEVGALAMVGKPRGASGEEARKLVQTIRLMAEVKVVRRWPRAAQGAAAAAPRPLPAPPVMAVPARVVALGASTGGPLVLRTILAGLRGDFPVPLLITQHISPGFTEGFAQWLTQSTGFPVALARHGEVLTPGGAYVAPDGMHLLVEPEGRACRSLLSSDPPENGHRPAVSRLFRSVASGFGAHAVAVLLSGMGRDGAAELRLLRECGALTVAQSLDSAVVPGMPGAAVELGAAVHVLAPADIAVILMRSVERVPAIDNGVEQSR
jgi:two-component system chemotaxis response regulator CheB